MGGVRLSVRRRSLAGVRPPSQREAVEMEGTDRCSCSDRSGLNEFRPVMPFPETHPGNRPRSNGAGSRVVPEKFSGILNRHPILNYANSRSLSGQCAFVQGRKHRPDRRTDITADKKRNRRKYARNQNRSSTQGSEVFSFELTVKRKNTLA